MFVRILGLKNKLNCVMSRVILLFSCLFLCFSQIVVGQEIPSFTIEFEEQSLRSALSELEKASQYRFIYQDYVIVSQNELIDGQVGVNQKFEDKTLFQILDVLLADSDFSFAVIGGWKVVVIYEMSETIQSQESTSFLIKGKILDENGYPAHASVYLKSEDATISHTERTFANIEGNFEITVDNPNTYLILLYIGHLPRVVHIKDAELIQLQPEPMSDEIIRTAPARFIGTGE
jgi:hypothetical protein